MIKLDTIDSTNNYAIQIIDADKAEHGLTILANKQTNGKGQRGKSWDSLSGDSLFMTIILAPSYELKQQALFLAAIAVAVVESLQDLLADRLSIKWPNDIILADKKAGGILIENIVRGHSWQWAVIGIGINIGALPPSNNLPYATSLNLTASKKPSMQALANTIKASILNKLSKSPPDEVLDTYNQLLYRKGESQTFKSGDQAWKATICEMNSAGQLVVYIPNGIIHQYTHGTVEWVWS